MLNIESRLFCARESPGSSLISKTEPTLMSEAQKTDTQINAKFYMEFNIIFIDFWMSCLHYFGSFFPKKMQAILASIFVSVLGQKFDRVRRGARV